MKAIKSDYIREGIKLIDNIGKNSLKNLLIYSTFGAGLDLIGIGIVIPLVLSATFGSFQGILELLPETIRPLLSLNTILIGFVIFVVFKTVISTAIIKYRSNVVYNISASVSSNLVRTLIKNPNDFYIYYGSGTASRLSVVECHNFAQSFINPIVTFVSEGVLLIAIFVFLFIVNAKIAMFLAFLFILLGLIYRQITKDRISSASQNRANADQARVNLIETFSTLSLETKSDEQQNWLHEKYIKENINSKNASSEYLFWNNLTRPYLEVLLYVVVLSFSGLALLNQITDTNNQTSIINSYELILYFVLAAIRSLPSVTRLISAFVSMRFSKAAILQLKDTFESLEKNKNKIDHGKSSIIFKHNASILSLNVNNYKVDLENGFKQNIDNLSIKGPGLIYIDGPSGSGKSTLLNHLSNIRDDFSGEIEWNLKTSEESEIKISLCPQHVYLLSGNLEENIFLGKTPSRHQEEQIMSIAKDLDFAKFINLGNKLNKTVIKNFGLTLSGGQRQRISLLRGIASSADVVLFDEPFSSLDSRYRGYLLGLLEEISRNKIVIITSHVDREMILSVANHTLTLNKYE